MRMRTYFCACVQIEHCVVVMDIVQQQARIYGIPEVSMEVSTECKTCGIQFYFNSRLKRHLRTQTHKNFVEFLKDKDPPSTVECTTILDHVYSS